MKPVSMTHAIQKDLHEREKAFNEVLRDSVLINRIFTEELSSRQLEYLDDQPFYLYAYDKGGLVYWNSNKILADCKQPAAGPRHDMLFNDRGIFLRRCLVPPGQHNSRYLTVLFPVQITYPIENDYLKSRFPGAPHVPLSTKVLVNQIKGGYPVHTLDERTTFYLVFSPADLPDWAPDNVMIALLLAALLTTIMWLQIFTVYLTRKRSYYIGFLVTAITIIGLRALTYVFGFPFNLDQLPLFSPQLYASSAFLPSLGDLILNALCFLWIVVFIIRHTPYHLFRGRKMNKALGLVLAVLFSILMIAYAFGFISIIRSLVLDSMIPFDVSHFYSITRYTIAGLFAIGITTGVACFVIYLFNAQMKYLVPNRWLKYTIVATVGIALIKLWHTPQDSLEFSYIIIGWLVLFFFLLDIENLSYDFDFFAPQMVFWAVFICLFSTGVLQYFNYVNEKEERLRFAETVVQQRDDIMAYTFKGISQSIKNDIKLKDFLLHPQQEKRRSINERFDALYLGGHLNRYQSKVLLYDVLGNPLFNNDTVSMQSLLAQTENAEPVTDTVLYYKEQALNGHYYLAHIPITLSYTDPVVVGHLFIDFMVKESGGESVYPELLQPGSVKGNQNEAGYYYGVYVNNRLITKTSEYVFPVYLDRSRVRSPYVFYNWRELSELYYKAGESKTVIVVRVHRLWLETITLFSYIFGVQMLLIIVVLLYRTYLSYFTKSKFTGRLINLTLRRRIHYSLLGVVLISFLIIGIVTIIYSTLQYQQSNRKKLQLVMQLVERTAQQYLKDRGALENNKTFENEVTSTEFQYFVTSLANAQKIDINVFNATGLLKVTSQENIYDKALLARIMQSDAYYMLALVKRSIHIQEEQVGRLTYLSCYVPIWSDNGKMLGFLNIPYFSSEKELSFQISNILVALINLYAFIFLVSSLLTVFITRWLTRTLSIVINRFERLSLTRNELIDWPYEDEIGMLVKEYNKMVRKVEENAAMLARNEREGAWREMAQQVAHEIKNPLTPMKLNIQYLQQALKNDYPNVKELAAKVSESLIEQIDNLSYIASEFSNFAKMPEAIPEEIELNDVLSRTVELYLNEQDVKVAIEPYQEPLSVYADRSQLLRVFTNLIENAVQAIPEGRVGKVLVTLAKEDNHILISFADNGVGIPANTIEKIFQPYFTTKTSGTGLGLAMTKKIIEFWKGSIWFETEEGKGTTFYIRMPLYRNI